uniref:Uncharacterized protein n=1 Tax=Arundo donax TaxID=35708 RepID=A0A0A9CP59_ARUDO
MTCMAIYDAVVVLSFVFFGGGVGSCLDCVVNSLLITGLQDYLVYMGIGWAHLMMFLPFVVSCWSWKIDGTCPKLSLSAMVIILPFLSCIYLFGHRCCCCCCV